MSEIEKLRAGAMALLANIVPPAYPLRDETVVQWGVRYACEDEPRSMGVGPHAEQAAHAEVERTAHNAALPGSDRWTRHAHPATVVCREVRTRIDATHWATTREGEGQ